MNDVVLAIMELVKPSLSLREQGSEESKRRKAASRVAKVLYIDTDVHHGDGVEAAFRHSPNVLAVSFHGHGPGFYPGSGGIEAQGGSVINVPLRAGCSDATYLALFREVTSAAVEDLRPDFVVFVCGADQLAGDPLGRLNLSSEAIVSCAEHVHAWGIPTLVLGGGGYSEAKAAAVWCRVSAVFADAPLASLLVPADEPFFAEYASMGFELRVPSLPAMADLNTSDYIASIRRSLFNEESEKEEESGGSAADSPEARSDQ